MKHLEISIHRALALTGALLWVGCQDDQVVTTTRNLDRPGPVALVCAGRVGDAGTTTGLPPSACTTDAGTTGGPQGTLFGFVANTARGEVAVFQPGASGEPLVDLDRGSPGFGFIPVGNLPTDLAATSDGCRVITANRGSCDLAVIDVMAVMRVASSERKEPFGGVVSRIIPRTKSGRLLRARPHEIQLVPTSAPASGSCPRTEGYHAYVTFPSCNLLAEIDLTSGTLVQSVIIGRNGFYPTDEPHCPVECTIRGDKVRVDSGALDYGPAADLPAELGPAETTGPTDAGPADGAVADAAPADAGPMDSAAGDAAASDSGAATTGDVLPQGLALSAAGDRIYVSSGNAGFISVLNIDPQTGAFVDARRITLSDNVATTRIRLSPGRVLRPSNKTDSGVEPYAPRVGQFLYAIARDRSVRVIAVDLEQECETNLDLAAIDGGSVPLDRARCMVVGAAQTPPRRAVDRSTGLRFGARVPQEVSFVTSLASQNDSGIVPNAAGVYADAGATPLRGIFAMVALSDGTVYAVDVEDWNHITPAVTSVPVVHLPHRPRNGLQGAEGGEPDASVVSVTGVGSGGVPVVVSQFETSCSKDSDCPAGAVCPGGSTDRRCAYPGQGVILRGVGEAVATDWPMEYEARVVGRWSGRLGVQGDHLVLSDEGANFCKSGVLARTQDSGRRELRHGDIVEFVGCASDDECGLDQVCVKPVTQQTDTGLCFDRDRQDELFQRCAAFLRGARDLRAVRAEQGRLTLDALPEEPQAVIRQPSQPAGGCNTNSDCADGYFCALEARLINGRADLSIARGECFRPGCVQDRDCGSGHCVQPLDGGPKVCAPVPLPLETGPACKTDGDCDAPSSLPQSCDTDKDCGSQLAECRRVTSQDTTKRCVDRDMRCSTFPGLKARCARISPCFSELLRYNVRVGRSFTIGAYHRVIVDPITGDCVEDPGRSPLLSQRIPVGLATYPAVTGPTCPVGGVAPLSTPAPNPCFERAPSGYAGYLDPGTSPPLTVSRAGPATVVRFSNPDIWTSMGLSHLTNILATDTPTDAGVGSNSYSNMPERGLTILLNLGSGSARMRTATTTVLSLPVALAEGPDGFVYVVDMGNLSGSTGANGQIRRFDRTTLELDTFIVR